MVSGCPQSRIHKTRLLQKANDMKRIVHLLTPVVLAAVVSTVASFGADAPATPGQSVSTTLVGDYGHKSALLIEGNHTFTKEQILSGMKLHLDYHLAAHPAALLADYTAWLERKITLGYQRDGFPLVTVKAAADADAHRVLVQLNEGPRYRCGDILLSGMQSMTNELVRQKIADVIGGSESATGSQTNLDSVNWLRDHPSPLDEFSRESLKQRVQEALAALNYYQPTVSVRIVPDPVRKLADLNIEIADEGIKGAIAEIEVSGLYTNTRPQLLDYLKLKPGMEVNAKLIAATTNQLWSSARFFRHDVSLSPLPGPGQFKLKLDLEEVREAPPLNQEFSPKEKALLKFRDWLAGWETRSEAFVLSVQLTNASLQGRADLIFSPKGMALAVRDMSSNRLAKLQYAIVASKELLGLYSVWRQSKFTMPRTRDGGSVLLKVRPGSPKSYGLGDVSFMVNMNLPQSQPFRLEMELQPAVFLSMAHWMDSSLKDGVLTLSQNNEEGQQEIRIDAATGRLLQASASSNERSAFALQLHLEEGLLDGLLKEIATVTADHPNRYVTNRGFSSWASFLLSDVMKPPLLEMYFDGDDDDTSPERSSTNSAAVPSQIKTRLALARELLGQQDVGDILDPLSRILGPKTNKDDETDFVVPRANSPTDSPTGPLAEVCKVVLNVADDLLPHDTWPWVLLRESAFTMAGQNNYTKAELEKLQKSDDVGPVGCLATAYLVGRINPKLARTFAERGLARLNLDEFRKDYRLLLRTNYIVGDLASKALGLLNGGNEAKLAPLLAGLAPDEAAFLRQLMRLLAAGKGQGQPPSEVMWPAFEQHWNKVPRRYLEMGLNHFLPQVQFLTNSQALFERGRALISAEGPFLDPDEAAQCFRKAAAQGHAGAQLTFGHLCEDGRGVPKDFAEAMRWYRKAAEQKEPHANCSIAALYHFGKGMPQDLDEAVKLYRPEAEGNCVYSQINLGQIYETRNDMDEALNWYRLAAGEGATPAQAKLGDLLSDGLFTKPDYVEACQWLSLAAAGDKISEVRLRRVKAKLSAGQLTEVERRVAAVTQHLEEKKKSQVRKATKQ